jgi:hypothetical protein
MPFMYNIQKGLTRVNTFRRTILDICLYVCFCFNHIHSLLHVCAKSTDQACDM